MFGNTDTYKPRVAAPEDGDVQMTPSSADLRSGRSASQLKPVFTQTSAISQASGSAYVEMGATKVIVGVYGPHHHGKLRENEAGLLVCDFKYAPFALPQRRKRGQDPDERENSRILTEALSPCVQLEKFPKSVVEIHVLVLEGAGGVLNAAITCASLALADAGIDMFDVLTCTSVIKPAGNDTLLVDPCAGEEEAKGAARMTVAYMPNLKEITYFSQSGSMPAGKTEEMLCLCVDGCEQLQKIMQDTLCTTKRQESDTSTQDTDMSSNS